MRNLTKFVATAAFGAAIVMSGSAPSYAFTSNVTDALSYFSDCLAKLGTEDTCGGPHEINKGTSSVGSLSGFDPGLECGRYEIKVYDGHGGYCDCPPKKHVYARFAH
jgi:hypothetical protein